MLLFVGLRHHCPWLVVRPRQLQQQIVAVGHQDVAVNLNSKTGVPFPEAEIVDLSLR
jgi:hypothetical protein